MDKKERIVKRHLEYLMKKIKTADDLGYFKRFIEFYESRGYDVRYFKQREEDKEKMLNAFIYN